MRCAQKYIECLSDILVIVSSIILVVMMAVTVMAVFTRYILRSPMGWSVELTSLMQAAAVMLALAYTLKVRGHVAVDVLVTRLPQNVRLWLAVATSTIALALSGILVCTMYQMALEAWREDIGTMSALLPLAPGRFAMALGALALCLQFTVELGKLIHSGLQRGN